MAYALTFVASCAVAVGIALAAASSPAAPASTTATHSGRTATVRRAELDAVAAEHRAALRSVIHEVHVIGLRVDLLREETATAWATCVVPGDWYQVGVLEVPPVRKARR